MASNTPTDQPRTDGRLTRWTTQNLAKEAEILQYIREYRETHGYSPSIPEIGAAVGRAEFSVLGHLGRMEEKGLITRLRTIPRSVVPVD